MQMMITLILNALKTKYDKQITTKATLTNDANATTLFKFTPRTK
jgi:hypothetical protein